MMQLYILRGAKFIPHFTIQVIKSKQNKLFDRRWNFTY